MKEEKDLEFIITKDGSHSLWNKELDETYHSRHGAWQEAQHVFIEAGLKKVIDGKKEIRILEVGFGTGMNALLTFMEMEDSSLNLKYTGIETRPLSESIWKKLNFIPEGQQDVFEKLHGSPWEQYNEIHSGKWLSKRKVGFENVSDEDQFDLIYYDAFGPNSQPAMWTEELMFKCGRLLRKGGVFVTYCCKGQVRRDLIKGGLEMEKIP
ncbi:MAG: tRNA (5-methylaminomethyl-2-thiouridine)(34)-methyltransferase MnmD, partial [Bacteroidota bacterium]